LEFGLEVRLSDGRDCGFSETELIMDSNFQPDWMPADNLPLALAKSGACPCGEHGYSIMKRRSTQGRGRPTIRRAECANCGRPLARQRGFAVSWLAAIYNYSPK
jgi:hypothetical protein